MDPPAAASPDAQHARTPPAQVRTVPPSPSTSSHAASSPHTTLAPPSSLVLSASPAAISSSPAPSSFVGSLFASASPASSVTVAPSPSPASSVLSALKAAASTWQLIDLDARRSEIDASALAMGDEEARAQTARRALADQTKAWKRLPSDAERSAQLGPLIRAYQEEVNQLTRRSTASEAAFLQLYRLLLDAPDPYRLLSAATLQLESLAVSEEALREAKQTLAEYEDEFRGLKNQDVSLRRLEKEKADLEAHMRSLVAEGVEERLSAHTEEMALMRRGFEERERMLTDKIDAYKEQLSATLSAHSSLASATLARDRHASERAEWAAEAEGRMLEQEIQRQAEAIAGKDKEIQTLRAQVQQMQEGSNGAVFTPGAEGSAAQWAAERAHLEEEVSHLQARSDAAEAQAQALQAKAEQLTRDLAAAQTEHAAAEAASSAALAALRSELASLPSQVQFEEMRKQLRAVQEIQYGSRSADAEHDAAPLSSPAAGAGAGAGVGAGAPSQLLLAKSRRLESELTTLKLAHASLETSLRAATADAETAQSELQQARETAAKLEEDLATANSAAVERLLQSSAQYANPAVQLRSTQPSPPDFTPKPAGAGVTPSSPTKSASPALALGLSVDTGLQPDGSSSPPLLSTLQAQLSQSSSMLSIVLSQRDRYRSRLEVVEAERSSAVARADEAKKEIATLRKDNLQLYEKLQYVKSFSGTNSAASSESHRADFGGSGTDVEAGYGGAAAGGVGSGALTRGAGGLSSSASESKYAQLYEARMDPFSAFKRRARSERESQLSHSERATLALGRALFTRKSVRTALFAYALILHLLVMVVLWTHSIGDHCGTEHGSKLAEHKH